MNRPRLNGVIKITSSDKIKRPEPIVYTGHKMLLIGCKEEFVKLIAY